MKSSLINWRGWKIDVGEDKVFDVDKGPLKVMFRLRLPCSLEEIGVLGVPQQNQDRVSKGDEVCGFCRLWMTAGVRWKMECPSVVDQVPSSSEDVVGDGSGYQPA